MIKNHKFEKYFYFTVVCLLVLIAFIVFFYRIDAMSMWLDEVAHWTRGQRSIDQIMNSRFIGQGQMSHLYYLLNKGSEYLFGNPDFSCRLPEALAAVASVIFIYLLGVHLYGRGAGVLACVFFITSPFIVKYAQMNRYYHLGSVATLASYYFFVRYLDTKKYKMLIGWIISMSFFLRVHNNGLLCFGTFGGIMMLLFITTLVAKNEKTFYRVTFKDFLWVGGAALIVLALWSPCQITVMKHILSKGAVESGKKVFDAFWTGKVGLDLPSFVYMFKHRAYALGGLNNGTLLTFLVFLSAFFSSLLFKKGRAIVLYLFAFISTVLLFYVMNNSKAEVMPKRVIYLYPIMAIFIAGGLTGLICIIYSTFLVLSSKVKLLKIPIKLFGILIALFCFMFITYICLIPVIGNNLYNTIQYYYSDKVPYKVIAGVITDLGLPYDAIWWYPQVNDAWLMRHYQPSYAKTKYMEKNLHDINKDKILNELNKSTGLWLHRINPKKYGFSEKQYIPFMVARKWTYLMRKEYLTNSYLRDIEAERLYKCLLNTSKFPETEDAKLYIDLLEARSANIESEKVVQYIGSYSVSKRANGFTYNYFRKKYRNNTASKYIYKFADSIFWIPTIQLEAAKGALFNKDYDKAIIYAKRCVLWPGGQDYWAFEIMAKAYSKKNEYSEALKFAKKALAYSKVSPNFIKYHKTELEKMKTDLQMKFDGGYGAYRLLQIKFEKDCNLDIQIQCLNLIENIVTNKTMRTKFLECCRNDPYATKLIDFTIKDKKVKDVDSLIDFIKSKTKMKDWTLYEYILNKNIPVDKYLESIIMWSELNDHGFPPIEKRSNTTLLLLGEFYNKKLGRSGCERFWNYISSNSAKHRLFAQKMLKNSEKIIYLEDNKTTNIFSEQQLVLNVRDVANHSLRYFEEKVDNKNIPMLKWGNAGYVEFEVELTKDKCFDLTALYSSKTPQPINVIVNDKLVLTNVGKRVTGGWNYKSAQNNYLGVIYLKKGTNVVKLKRSTKGHFFPFYSISLHIK